MPRKPEYHLALDYSPEKQKRLKQFCGATGVSVRAFASEALDQLIAIKLNNLEQGQREAIEHLIRDV